MAVTYFLTSTDTALCTASVVAKQMQTSVGSGSYATTNINSTAFTLTTVSNVVITGGSITPTSGTFNYSINVSGISGDVQYRFRISHQNSASACALVNSSAYSTTYTTTGVKTGSLSLTYTSGDILRFSVEILRASGHGNVSLTIASDSNSFITAPYPTTYNEIATGGIEGGGVANNSILQFINETGSGGLAVGDPSIDSPYAYWKLDEGTGSLARDSVSGFHGTLTGGYEHTTGVPNIQFGNDGAIILDGSTGYVDIPFIISPGAQSFSLCAWVRLDTKLSGAQTIWQQLDGGGTGRTWLYRNTSDGLTSFIGNTATNSTGTPFTNTGEWHHVGVTYNLSTGALNLYIDGAVDGTNTVTAGTCSGTYRLGMHKSPGVGSNEEWGGAIDDVRLYTRELSPAEFSTLFSGHHIINENVSGGSPLYTGTGGATLGGTTSVNPSDISGLALWLDPSSLALSDGAAIASWTDSSGNGNDASQATAEIRPTYDTDHGFYHDRPLVFNQTYNQSDRRMGVAADASLDNGTFTYAFVFKPSHIVFSSTTTDYRSIISKTNTNPNTVAFHMQSSGSGAGAVSDGKFHGFMRTAAAPGTLQELICDTPVDQNLHFGMLRYDGSTFEMYIDNVLVDSLSIAGAADTSNSNALSIGGLTHSTDAGFPGWLGDILVYNNAISDADRDHLWYWYQARYPQPWNKVTETPVIGVSSTKTHCDIEYDPANDRYVMVYSDQVNNDRRYATSPRNDPHNWTDQNTTILTNGTGGAWDDDGGTGNCLVYYSGTWYLYYDDKTSGQIGVATGTDIESLTKYVSNPILSGTGSGNEEFVRHPAVVTPDHSHDGQWHMIYDGRNGTASSGVGALYHATSSDGFTWTKDTANNPVISPTGLPSFDRDDVGTPDVVRIRGVYYMTYHGFNVFFRTEFYPTAAPHQIGVATSTDLVNWTISPDSPDSPVLPNAVDLTHFDVLATTGGSWLMPGDGKLYKYYTGVNSDNTLTAIGYAVSSDIDALEYHYETATGGAEAAGVAPNSVESTGPKTYNEIGSGGAEAGGEAIVVTMSTYNEVASGGIEGGGVVVPFVVSNKIASGGIEGGGEGIASLISDRIASGGIEGGGEDIEFVSYNITATGGIEGGGDAIVVAMSTYNEVASGGIEGGSSAVVSLISNRVATGGAEGGGDSTLSLISDRIAVGGIETGGAVVDGEADVFSAGTYNEIATGGAETAGETVVSLVEYETATGGAEAGGVANDDFSEIIETFGGSEVGGTGTLYIVYNITPTDGSEVGGEIVATFVYANTATGGAEISGDVDVSLVRSDTSTGGTEVGGETTENVYDTEEATGGAILAGDIGQTFFDYVEASGGVVIGGLSPIETEGLYIEIASGGSEVGGTATPYVTVDKIVIGGAEVNGFILLNSNMNVIALGGATGTGLSGITFFDYVDGKVGIGAGGTVTPSQSRVEFVVGGCILSGLTDPFLTFKNPRTNFYVKYIVNNSSDLQRYNAAVAAKNVIERRIAAALGTPDPQGADITLETYPSSSVVGLIDLILKKNKRLQHLVDNIPPETIQGGIVTIDRQTTNRAPRSRMHESALRKIKLLKEIKGS